MFGACSSLTNLDISSFKVNNVTDMSVVFQYCSNLTNLTLPTLWETNNVTDMGGMF
jgi:surface protein